jgi:hypothetical protein
MTGVRRVAALAALGLTLVAAPARSADCPAMQNAYQQWNTASDALDRETERYNALPTAPKSDAALCQAAKATQEAIENLELYLDKTCLQDASAYDSMKSQLDDMSKHVETMAGLSCGPA